MSLVSGSKRKLFRRQNRVGYLFILPFLFGFVAFLLVPIAQSIVFTFNELQIVATGYELTPRGWRFYERALFVDTRFRVMIVDSLLRTITDVPVIIAFSLFIAVLLNQRFRGRTLARAVFFLPVIISTGYMAIADQGNPILSLLQNRNPLEAADKIRESVTSYKLVMALLGDSLPLWMTDFAVQAAGRIGEIVTRSGLQIIIFLGALNTIHPSLYEASSMEGATPWENFWKITFPMVGPYILVNVVYTIIDSFTNMSSQVMRTVQGYIVYMTDFSFGLTLAWLYFILLFLILALVFFVMSKRVFYYD